MDGDPLEVSTEMMRRLGHLTVDWLADRAARRDDEPALLQATPAEMARRVPAAAPSGGEPFEAVLEHLAEHVLPYRSRTDHPRYLAYVPGEGTWPGALGDLVAAAFNIDAGNWMESAGPSCLESTILGWFAEWIGYPAGARGLLVSGGSAANLTALACAREALVGAMRPDLVVYVSEQGHSSLARACRVLGFRRDQVRVLPVDTDCRMRVDALQASVRADSAAGLTPLAVLAVAGTTNTGAIDDLPALSEIARASGLWLHVDAAYGGFAVITPRGKELLGGLDRADSVTLDPHKWLYQPFECGAVLVREGHLLRDAFEIHPAYLQDTSSRDEAVNLAEHGLQLTRMSRALKLWLSLRYFGVEAFAAAVGRAMDIAAHAQHIVEDSAELELLAPATLGIVCFRRRPAGCDDEAELEALNAGLIAALADSGLGLVSSTRLFGRYAVRACVLNHSTTHEDVEQVLRWLEQAPLPTSLQPLTAVKHDGPSADLRSGRPADAATELDVLARVPLLTHVDPARLVWLGEVGRRRQVPAGEVVVRQWSVDRDFYLVLSGVAEVWSGDRLLTSMTPGDFFGELAALDWGATFGYPRLATVTARSDLDLLVLSDAQLAELMAAAPDVDRQIRSSAAARAGRL